MPRIADLPGPRPLPLVGNVLQISIERIHQQLEAWAREYDGSYVFHLGPRTFAVVSEPALVHAVLRDRPAGFCKTNAERICEELGIPGPISSEGASWQRQRRLVMAALAQRHMASFYPTLRAVTERFIRRLRVHAAAGEAVDIQGELMRLLVDATTTLAIGRDFNTIDGGDELMQLHLEQIFAKLMSRLTAAAPYWRVIELPSDRTVRRAVAAIREILADSLADARAAASDSDAAPSNFLAAMAEARDEHDRAFDEQVMFGNLVQILLAGEDTTANTIAWAVHHLCDNPRVVEALVAEADAVLDGAPVLPDFERAESLTYARAVASEALRLRPVLPVFFFTANADTELTGLEVAAGEHLIVLTRPAGTDARFVARPRAFEPERWLDEGAEVRLHKRGVYVPFGSGPRICAGRTLALLELRVILSALYRNFEIERVGPSEAIEETLQMTMRPVGLRVRLSPR